jgi:hypothetical protein
MPRRQRPWLLLGAAAIVLTASVRSAAGGSLPAPERGVAGLAGGLPAGPARPWDVGPYGDHGAWVDVFDYLPILQDGGVAPVTPDSLEDMADAGVRTLFIQAAFHDDRTPGPLTDTDLLGRFVVRAHANDIAVVGWYLPRFGDVTADLIHLLAIDGFSVGGHRFDGLAVDIEYTADVPDVAARNDRLVTLSEQLRSRTGGQALGAIVLPPVLTEVVNPGLWPDFPWDGLDPAYDVWLPMSYWTARPADSGDRDGFSYNEESTRRLREALGDPQAVVHAIGGIGDETDPAALTEFARSLAETGAIGGSVYDWATLDETARTTMEAEFRAGAAADLPPP